jgi:hypothetical protein
MSTPAVQEQSIPTASMHIACFNIVILLLTHLRRIKT